MSGNFSSIASARGCVVRAGVGTAIDVVCAGGDTGTTLTPDSPGVIDALASAVVGDGSGVGG
jgi:hypothetical protein